LDLIDRDACKKGGEGEKKETKGHEARLENGTQAVVNLLQKKTVWGVEKIGIEHRGTALVNFYTTKYQGRREKEVREEIDSTVAKRQA